MDRSPSNNSLFPSHGDHDGGSNANPSLTRTKSDPQEETFGPVIGIQKVGEPEAELQPV